MNKLPERLNYLDAIEKPELRIEIAAKFALKEIFGRRFNDLVEGIQVVDMSDSYLLNILICKEEVAELLKVKIREVEQLITIYSRLKVKVRIEVGTD